MAERIGNNYTRKELPVLLTVDVCDGSFDQGDRKSRFTALMDVLPEIRDILGDVISRNWGNLLPVTWFVRADMQVKDITGNALGLFHGWREFWEDCTLFGGEIGWHPHVYKRHGQNWIPIRDHKKLKSAIDRIWHEISGGEFKPVTSRMGESVASNELMQSLDNIGILADSSALPGRKRDDGLRWFDWETTPDSPYHPSRGDYRRPTRAYGSGDRVEAEESLSILQIPFTMAGIRAPYDPDDTTEPGIRRYIDLSFDHEVLKAGLGSIYKHAEYLMLVVHPMQAAGLEVPDGGLVAGGTRNLSRNLKLILGSIEKFGRIPRLVTVADFAKRQMGIVDDTPVVSKAPAEEREQRDTKKKGGSLRTKIESQKAARLTTKGGVTPDRRRHRPDPRKRQG